MKRRFTFTDLVIECCWIFAVGCYYSFIAVVFGYLTLAKMYAAGTIWCGFVSAKLVKNCIWKMGMIIKHSYLFVTFNDQAYILLTLF
jgi:hypothetical protein